MATLTYLIKWGKIKNDMTKLYFSLKRRKMIGEPFANLLKEQRLGKVRMENLLLTYLNRLRMIL